MTLTFVTALLFVVAAFAEDIEVDDPDVERLTQANFDTFIASHEFVLAEFYAPWCGHCKRLAPEYAKAATALKEKGSPARLAKIDATVDGDLAKKFGVSGYPTIKFFRNGEPTEYDGGRTESEIVSWVSKKSMPVSKLLASQDDIDTFAASGSSRIIAYVNSNDEAVWLKVAGNAKFDELAFGHVTDSALFGDRSSGTIEIHRDGNVQSDSGANEALLALIHKTRIQQRPKVYASHWSEFLSESAFPLVDNYSEKVAARAEAKRRDLLVVFSPDVEATATATKIAEQYKGKVVVATASDNSVASQWGSSGNVSPVAVLITSSKKPSTQVIWNEDSEGPMSEASLLAFVESARAGTYESYIKSEPIPEEQGAVTTLVGKTLPDAIKQGKDVFVEFYAPWCGHCKNLAPIWDELGEAYADDDNVVIAKIDATANKIPSNINVRGFPTLIFFNAKGKQLSYGGERTLDALKAYVESKRSKVVKTEEPAKEKEDL